MTGTPRIGVLALQGDVREHVQVLTGLGAETVLVRRTTDLPGLSGVVLPGGESTAIGTLLVRFDLLGPLRDAVAGGLPVYGSCAGMVLLAREVVDGLPGQPLVGGLDVVVRRNAFGSQVDSFESDVAFDGLDSPVRAVFIRAPWVESCGSSVQVLARVAGDGPAAGRVVAVRQGAALATSFHPELTGDSRVHRAFLSMVRESS